MKPFSIIIESVLVTSKDCRSADVGRLSSCRKSAATFASDGYWAVNELCACSKASDRTIDRNFLKAIDGNLKYSARNFSKRLTAENKRGRVNADGLCVNSASP